MYLFDLFFFPARAHRACIYISFFFFCPVKILMFWHSEVARNSAPAGVSMQKCSRGWKPVIISIKNGCTLPARTRVSTCAGKKPFSCTGSIYESSCCASVEGGRDAAALTDRMKLLNATRAQEAFGCTAEHLSQTVIAGHVSFTVK